MRLQVGISVAKTSVDVANATKNVEGRTIMCSILVSRGKSNAGSDTKGRRAAGDTILIKPTIKRSKDAGRAKAPSTVGADEDDVDAGDDDDVNNEGSCKLIASVHRVVEGAWFPS